MGSLVGCKTHNTYSTQSAGTMEATLTQIGEHQFTFTYTPQCDDENDYLICNGNAFQDDSSFLFQHQNTKLCKEFGTIDINFSCSKPCINSDNCVGVSIFCLDVTRGVALTIKGMPSNLKC